MLTRLPLPFVNCIGLTSFSIAQSGIHPVFPDRQDVVALAKHRFRAIAHADDIQRRQHGHICMDRALIIKFVAQRLRFLLWQPVAVVQLLDQRRRGLRVSVGGVD